MGISLSNPISWWKGKTKNNSKNISCADKKNQNKHKIKIKKRTNKCSVTPDNINIKLFECSGTNNGNVDICNNSLSLAFGSPSVKAYRPKTDPIRCIKGQLKAESTHQENIKKIAFLYKIIPKLNTDKQMKMLLDTLPGSSYSFGPLLTGLDRGQDRLSKATFHKINNFMTDVSRQRCDFRYDKTAMLRFKRHTNSIGAPHAQFSLDAIYYEWNNMSNLDIIAMECGLAFNDKCILLTSALDIQGNGVLRIRCDEVQNMAKMYKYGNNASQLVWNLIKIMKKVILHQTRGDHMLPQYPCLT